MRLGWDINGGSGEPQESDVFDWLRGDGVGKKNNYLLGGLPRESRLSYQQEMEVVLQHSE